MNLDSLIRATPEQVSELSWKGMHAIHNWRMSLVMQRARDSFDRERERAGTFWGKLIGRKVRPFEEHMDNRRDDMNATISEFPGVYKGSLYDHLEHLNRIARSCPDDQVFNVSSDVWGETIDLIYEYGIGHEGKLSWEEERSAEAS